MSIQLLQVLAVWIALATGITTGAWALLGPPRGRTHWRSCWLALGLSLAALLVRLFQSPATLLHENAHGYEFVRSALELEGYFFHGATYYAVFHPVTELLGQHHLTISYSNLLLSVACAFLATLVAARLFGSLLVALAVGGLIAFSPPLIRISMSESMFPLAIFLGLLSSYFALSSRDRSPFYSSLACTAFAVCAIQCRPVMVFWSIIPLTLVALSSRQHSTLLDRTKTGLVLVVPSVLLLPWLAFRIADLVEHGVPSYFATFTEYSAHRNFALDCVLFLQSWSPSWLVPACIAGAIYLWIHRRAYAIVLIATWSLVFLFSVSASGEYDVTRLRLQSPLLVLSLVIAGGTVGFFSRFAAWPLSLVATGAILVAAALAMTSRSEIIDSRYLPQQEYDFISSTRNDVPPDCLIVLADREMADGVMTTDYPTWLFPNAIIRLSEYVEATRRYDEFDCRLFYRGLTCSMYSWQELANTEQKPPVVRSECDALPTEDSSHLALESRLGGKNDVGYLVPSTTTPTIGYYRVQEDVTNAVRQDRLDQLGKQDAPTTGN